MALNVLTTELNEQGSGTIEVALTDSTGAEVTPNTLKWSFYAVTKVGATYTKGEPVNNLTDKDVTGTLGPTVYIVLSGDDLAILGSSPQELRALTLTGTYDTTINGVAFTNHPFKMECIVKVSNLLGV